MTEVIDSDAGLLESTTSTTATETMQVNFTTTEAPYNGEESENRLEDLDTFSNMTNMTSKIMTNVTSQMTISDQQDAQQVKILVTHGITCTDSPSQLSSPSPKPINGSLKKNQLHI